MSFSTRLKLIPSAGGYDVMCLVKAHAAELRNAHIQPYIRSITFYVNNAVVAEIHLGANVSYEPIMGIHLTTLKTDDKVSIMWIDTLSRRGSAEVVTK